MPTVTLSPTEMARHDLANGNWRNCGSASATNAYSGVGSSTSDGKTYYRALLNFNISTIPSTSVIQSAKLTFYVTGGSSTSQGSYIRARLINQSWTSAKPSWGGGSTSGNHTANYIDSQNSGYIQLVGAGTYSIDITASLMQRWVKASGSYYGFALIVNNETTDTSTGYSMDGAKVASLKHIAHLTYPTTSYRPKLEINYSSPTVSFNGNQVSKIVFNGQQVTSLKFNQTTVY